MKLQARFVQLPLQFDAEQLAEEINRLDASAWLPHPGRFPGNDFLPLISARGDPKNEGFAEPMRPTPYLAQCPYLVDVLASLGASIGRTRLMRLSGHAEVTPHFDANYYWRERMRVHVPIVTQPTVRFICGDEEVNMKPGECWIFDTWALHRVINDSERQRVHLVVDTVGGGGFWEFAARGRNPRLPGDPNWAPRNVPRVGASIETLDLESVNVPIVMTPWEAREHITFLLSETHPSQPGFDATARAASQFLYAWQGLWSTYGESREGWPRYRHTLDSFSRDIQTAGAKTLVMGNGGEFMISLSEQVLKVALADRAQDNEGERRDSPARGVPNLKVAAPARHDPVFDRPVFIINPPRSGSSLLFETLALSPSVYTIGGESHGLIEGVDALNAANGRRPSNRLDETDATPEVIGELRARFASNLRDRSGKPPLPHARLRMLEKTPKNALRAPFLAAAFPEARFIYLYRDPREVLASMMEGWESGRFRTYPDLPGWSGDLPWSFLLTPGWRELAQFPLHRRVAEQWAITTRILLDDLEAMPAERWMVARYDALIASPSDEVRRICDAMQFDWDRPLGMQLPLSSHTVSRPSEGKWRARESEIEAALPFVRDVAERAARFAVR